MKMILAAAIALSSLGAGVASAQPAHIPFGDLNLSTAAGAAAFDARIDSAAHALCRNATQPASHLNDSARCAAAVRAEAMARLSAASRRDYALARLPMTL
jgi:UrcA family protein